MLEVVEHSADTAHQMYHMAVVLHILVELHLHIVAVAAQIVSGKVDEHHMLGILLWVVTQILCMLGNAPQCPVQFKVIAFITLHETAAEHYLKHIATATMSNATANVSFMLLVGQGAHGVAHRMEIVDCKVMVADNAFKVINAVRLRFRQLCAASPFFEPAESGRWHC